MSDQAACSDYQYRCGKCGTPYVHGFVGCMPCSYSPEAVQRREAEVPREAVCAKLALIAANRENFLSAFIAQTGLRPSECVMVEQDCGGGRTEIRFERRSSEPNRAAFGSAVRPDPSVVTASQSERATLAIHPGNAANQEFEE